MAVTKIWKVTDSISRVIDYCNDPVKTKFTDLEHVIKYASNEEKSCRRESSSMPFPLSTARPKRRLKKCGTCRSGSEKPAATSPTTPIRASKPAKSRRNSATGSAWSLPEKCGATDIKSSSPPISIRVRFTTTSFSMPSVCGDGRKYDCSKREYYRLRRLSDEMCAREGLMVIQSPHKKVPRPIYIAEKNGEPTKYNLMREAIDNALSMSWNHNSFVDVMKSQGYIVSMPFGHKHGTIRSINAKRVIRLYHLGEQYDRQAIEAQFYENYDYDFENTRQRYDKYMDPYTREWIVAHPPGKDYEYRKKFYYTDFGSSNLVEIYLTLFVLLLDLTIEAVKLAYELLRDQSTIPEYVLAVRMRPKSPEMKEAERFLDRRTNQMLLMSEAKFKTADEIRDYIAQRELDIIDVKKYREHWRNKLRNATDPKLIAEYKQKRDKCTDYLTRLRFQKDTAQTILNDVPKVRELLRAEQNVQRGLDPYEHAKGFKMKDAKETEKTVSR